MKLELFDELHPVDLTTWCGPIRRRSPHMLGSFGQILSVGVVHDDRARSPQPGKLHAPYGL
jgi:hypothetical protein